MRKTLLAVALSVTALSAHADYQCSVTPRDDVILSPHQVQVTGENGDLVIKPDGNLTYNGKQYSLSAAQREQAQDYQAGLRSSLPWIDDGARSRVEKGRQAPTASSWLIRRWAAFCRTASTRWAQRRC